MYYIDKCNRTTCEHRRLPHIIKRQKDFLGKFCSGHDDDIMTGLLRGKNMNHELHFLPTFLAPITPPQDMIDNYKPRSPHELKGSHGHSELDCIVCFDSQKPNTAIKLFNLSIGQNTGTAARTR